VSLFPPELEPWLDKVAPMDVRDYCRALPPESVHTIITSVPYFRQREYEGVYPSVWGGLSFCDHDWEPIIIRDPNLSGGKTPKQSTNKGSFVRDSQDRTITSAYCSRCRAWLGTLGNEPNVEQYVANMLEIATGLWRVLRPDGTFWLNIDGKYNGSGGAGGDYNPGGRRAGQPRFPRTELVGYKPKDWIPVPWLVGIAFQQAGWWLRIDNIWHKPGGFCESARDRPTRVHEYVLLFTKRRKYYYDYDAVTEPAKYAGDKRSQRTDRRRGKKGTKAMNSDTGERRNRRSVWVVNTKPSGVEHYATFNPELIEPLIVAGAPEGGVVFDPFMGVGTTAIAAKNLGRHFLGCDASAKYVEIGDARILSQVTSE